MSINEPTPALGPCTIATLASPDAAALVDQYCSYLQCRVLASEPLTPGVAEQWDCPDLADAPCWLLGNALGHPWLRIIEDAGAEPAAPLSRAGWMSLEILVEDPDALAADLTSSPFKVLRPAANLELSDKIRAVQVQGPAGELLYLTRISGAVPPFQLPQARCAVDHLFIPVLASRDRSASLASYESLAQHDGLSFDTRVTVINQLRGLPLAQQHPLATLQLADSTLIEIDQLPDLATPPRQADSLGGGIAMITFLIDRLPPDVVTFRHREAPYDGRRSCTVYGHDGERIELIERTAH
ncbi:hypothetical protein [Microbulbifer hydrolyticus]|uniref:VOC family protein n=1 Tax=Microbulbifer hydrolyticus TaxID=48074 RepID=A0A6P1TCJ4_9GAMM|nr:hypothetical protein [Microbulbifer hydrolyticus]MBB5210126.1 hypothetical protein [Microbulbifer hydrolyticus]QHQ39356.1 hypothetical protein GTQ55_10395 [Microbulbifer hydrolyticus]